MQALEITEVNVTIMKEMKSYLAMVKFSKPV